MTTSYFSAFDISVDFPVVLKIFMYAIISAIISNCIIYPLAYLLTIPGEEFRRLYCVMKNDTGLVILKEW